MKIFSVQNLEQLLMEQKGYEEKRAKKAVYQTRIFVRSLLYSILIALILMWFHCLKEAIIVMIVLKYYRSYSGGIHIKNYVICFVSSLLLVGGIILLEKYLTFTPLMELMLWAINFLLWFNYVPQGTAARPIRNVLEKRKMKYSFLAAMGVTFLVRFLHREIYELCLYSMLFTLVFITPFAYRMFKVKHDRIEVGSK